MKPGTTLGNYRVDEPVGSGGMASVYRGTDLRSGARVALKVLDERLSLDSGQVERFRREAHVASLLRSPYTVRLLEFGSQDGVYYIVQEFVDGQPLSEVLKDGPLKPARAVSIAAQVALSLEEAADRGIVHRDVKPANILIEADGAARLADFGIASLAYDAGPTLPGMFIGTAAYAAPEQHSGRPGIQADIYSLGCVLFEMLTGRRPFPGTSVTALMREHEEMAPPLEAIPASPANLRAIVARCLAKQPGERYQRPSELVAALGGARDALEGDPAATLQLAGAAATAGTVATVEAAGGGQPPSTTIPGSAEGPGDRSPGNSKIAWGVTAAVAVVAVVVAAFALFGGGDADGTVLGQDDENGGASETEEPTTEPSPRATGTVATATVTATVATPEPTATNTVAPAPTATPTTAPPPPTPTPSPSYGLVGFSHQIAEGNLPPPGVVPPGGTLAVCSPPNVFTWVNYGDVPPGTQVQGWWSYSGGGASPNPISTIDSANGTLWFQLQVPLPGAYRFDLIASDNSVLASGIINVSC